MLKYFKKVIKSLYKIYFATFPSWKAQWCCNITYTYIQVTNVQLLWTDRKREMEIEKRERERENKNENENEWSFIQKRASDGERIICSLSRNQCLNAFCIEYLVALVWLLGLEICIFHTMQHLNANTPLSPMLNQSQGDLCPYWMV